MAVFLEEEFWWLQGCSVHEGGEKADRLACAGPALAGILELRLRYWMTASVYWMTGTLSMKDSVLATLANGQANELKIMSKIIYTQDLFCLLFDFKMFFPVYFRDVVLYVLCKGMRMCVAVDVETSQSLVTLHPYFVFYSEGLTEPQLPGSARLARWWASGSGLSPHPPKLLLEAQQLLQASNVNSSCPNPSPYTRVTRTLPTEPPSQPFSFIVIIHNNKFIQE